MKTTEGAFSLAWRKRSRTREAPTPTNISMNSEPLMLKKGTPASPATALAISVLPVPGGPIIRIPRGIRAPSALKRSGSRRNSITSKISRLAFSEPATSSSVTLLCWGSTRRARDLPMPKVPLPPVMRSCMRFQNQNSSASISSQGTTPISRRCHPAGSAGRAAMRTCCASRRSSRRSLSTSGRVVVKARVSPRSRSRRPESLKTPSRAWPRSVTSPTWPASTASRKSE